MMYIYPAALLTPSLQFDGQLSESEMLKFVGRVDLPHLD